MDFDRDALGEVVHDCLEFLRGGDGYLGVLGDIFLVVKEQLPQGGFV